MMYYVYMITTLENYTASLVVWTWLGIVSITTRILHWCRVRDLHEIKMSLAAQGIFQRDMHDAIRQVYKTRLIILGTTLAAFSIFMGVVFSFSPTWIWLLIVPVVIFILAAIGKPAKSEPEIISSPQAFPRIEHPVAMAKPGRFDSMDSAAIALHRKEPVRMGDRR